MIAAVTLDVVTVLHRWRAAGHRYIVIVAATVLGTRSYCRLVR